MPSEDSLFLVTRNGKSMLLRVSLTVFPGVLFAAIFREYLSNFAFYALIIVPMYLLGWPLVFRPAHYLEVHEDRLVHRNMLNNKEKTIAYAEIRNAYYRGFSLFRCLIVSDDSEKPIVRLEADMENLERLVEFLAEKHIRVNESKERT